MVLNALGMATRRRGPQDGLVIHSDRGVQFTSWAFSQKVRDAGIAPSMGALGTPADNAMIESFWGRMQVELFNRKHWKTRIELASAIHDYTGALAQHPTPTLSARDAHPHRIRNHHHPHQPSRLTPEPRLHQSRGRSSGL